MSCITARSVTTCRTTMRTPGASEIGRVAAVDCASRIGMFLGGTMAEGWACYATDLMDEVGFFTPEESLAQQHTRARLLARAVVDIGLHERTLTFDEARRDLSRSRRHVTGSGPRRDVQELDVPGNGDHVLARHRGAAPTSPGTATSRRRIVLAPPVSRSRARIRLDPCAADRGNCCRECSPARWRLIWSRRRAHGARRRRRPRTIS